MNIPTMAQFIEDEQHLNKMSDAEVHDAIYSYLELLNDPHQREMIGGDFESLEYTVVPNALLKRLIGG